MDLTRIIDVYIILMGICIYYSIIGFKILKRDNTNRINQLFSLFFFLTASGLIINFIYALISNSQFQDLVNLMNILTIYLVCLSFGFLNLAILLLDGRITMSNTKQIVFLVICSLICDILFIIPDSVMVPINSDGTQFSPIWSFYFALTVIIIVLLNLSLAWFSTLRLLKKYQNRVLKKKLKLFIIGISMFFYIALAITISNHFNDPYLRLIITISDIIAIPAAILVYYGIVVAPKISL